MYIVFQILFFFFFNVERVQSSSVSPEIKKFITVFDNSTKEILAVTEGDDDSNDINDLSEKNPEDANLSGDDLNEFDDYSDFINCTHDAIDCIDENLSSGAITMNILQENDTHQATTISLDHDTATSSTQLEISQLEQSNNIDELGKQFQESSIDCTGKNTSSGAISMDISLDNNIDQATSSTQLEISESEQSNYIKNLEKQLKESQEKLKESQEKLELVI